VTSNIAQVVNNVNVQKLRYGGTDFGSPLAMCFNSLEKKRLQGPDGQGQAAAVLPARDGRHPRRVGQSIELDAPDMHCVEHQHSVEENVVLAGPQKRPAMQYAQPHVRD
jgi:hypothetical protein